MIEIKHLTKHFKVNEGYLHAVDDVSFMIKKGKVMGLVGESGCGKSTTGRVILRLIEPTEGKILYKGNDICQYSNKQMKQLRNQMQMIFQDPSSCLNGRKTVGQIIAEPLIIQKILKRSEIKDKVLELMQQGGINPYLFNSYPHELDGGLRQRIGIIRSLALDPEFVVCDEPVSALDVSVRAKILNLLMDMQEQRNLTYLFISHDLSVVRHISTQIMVMYLGKNVEIASTEELFNHPAHPYTRALLSAVPTPEYQRERKERIVLEGEVTSPINPGPGCRFAGRCSYAKPICFEQEPKMRDINTLHRCACHIMPI